MTEYVVLRYQNIVGDHAQVAGGCWVEVGQADARSSSAAIRAVVDMMDAPIIEDTFTAIPLRSWAPVTVKVETKTALRFS